MVDIHVYVIPPEFWRDSLNSVSSDAVIEALSAGFLQVDPEITLAEIRRCAYEQLQSEIVPADFFFLRIVGRCLAKVSEKQEVILRAKSFLPPFTFSPDIYVIDSRVTKRTFQRSNGSNSDVVSLPRLTPNLASGGGAGDQDFMSPMNDPSPRNTYAAASSMNTQTVEKREHRGDIDNFDRQPGRKSNEPLDENYLLVPVDAKGDPVVAGIENSDVLSVKLEIAKRERSEIEVRRKTLLKRLHELQETVQQKRKEAYEYWRARFADEKGRTPYLEDQASTLGKDIDNLHKKLVRQMGNHNSGDNTLLSRQLQVLKLRQTVDLLKLKSEEGHTKLMCQIRLRNQAETELRAMRAELTQKKVLVQLLKSKLPAAADIV